MLDDHLEDLKEKEDVVATQSQETRLVIWVPNETTHQVPDFIRCPGDECMFVNFVSNTPNGKKYISTPIDVGGHIVVFYTHTTLTEKCNSLNCTRLDRKHRVVLINKRSISDLSNDNLGVFLDVLTTVETTHKTPEGYTFIINGFCSLDITLKHPKRVVERGYGKSSVSTRCMKRMSSALHPVKRGKVCVVN
jgi:hypothetical protein